MKLLRKELHIRLSLATNLSRLASTKKGVERHYSRSNRTQKSPRKKQVAVNNALSSIFLPLPVSSLACALLLLPRSLVLLDPHQFTQAHFLSCANAAIRNLMALYTMLDHVAPRKMLCLHLDLIIDRD
jgi:hypothetical protein